MLSVSEIFYSLQGEGPWQGRPCVFLRLAGCLAPFCSWCDTVYAHDANQGQQMTNHAIVRKVQSLDPGSKQLVVTGGEPFLQWHLEMETLLRQCEDIGFQVQFETSGRAIIPDLQALGFEKHFIVVVSPKYLNEQWDFLPENAERAGFYKFVLFQEKDMGPVIDFIQQYHIPHEKIFLMPGGADAKSILHRQKFVFDLCLKNGFQFTSRMHILVYGRDKKGV